MIFHNNLGSCRSGGQGTHDAMRLRFILCAAFWLANVAAVFAAPAVPVTLSGLTNEYSFDVGSGTLAVDSIGGNNAQLVNFAAGNSQWITGIYGSAVNFTNANSYIVTNSAILANNFSVSFWVRLDANANSNSTDLLTPEGANWIGYDQGHGIGIGSVYDSVPPLQGVWENYVVTVNQTAGTAAVYRDGALRASGASLPALDAPWVFGHNQDPGNTNGSLYGGLDEIQFYNRVLSASDASALATRPPQPGIAAHLVVPATSYGSQPVGQYATASITLAINPSQTNWIAWNRFPDLRAVSDTLPGEDLLGTYTPEVDDYFNLTVTNPLGQKLTVAMDQNGGLGAPIGQQSLILGASANSPEVVRGDNTGTPYFFNETGAFNSIFTVPGNYEFDLSFQNIGGSAGYPNVYLLVDTTPTPEPSSLALLAVGIFCLAGYGLRRRATKMIAKPSTLAQRDTPLVLAFPSHSSSASHSSVTLWLGICITALPSVGVAQTVNATSNFNAPNYTLGQPLAGQGQNEPGWSGNTWTTWYENGASGPTGTVIAYADSAAQEGNGDLQFLGTASDEVGAYRSWSSDVTTPFWINQYVRMTSGTGSTSTFAERFGTDGYGPPTSAYWEISNGNFVVCNGAGVLNTGIAIQPMQWQEISLLINPATASYEFFVNGHQFRSPQPLMFAQNLGFVDELNYLVNQTAWVDNIQVSSVTVSSWAAAVSGSWSNAGNWVGAVPNGIATGAVFNPSTTAALTVTLDAPQAVGSLLLGNSGSAAVGYTLSGVGSNGLTLDNAGAGTTITVTNGTHAINTPLILNDNVTISNSGALTIGGTIANGSNGPMGITLSSGPLVLATGNTFSGNTTISGGTLNLAHSLAVQNSTVTLSGGVLSFAAGNTGPTLGGLAGSGNVALASAASEPVTLNVGNNGQNTVYSGILSGAGGLTKIGSGTLSLTSPQSYSGPTSVMNGTLQLGVPVNPLSNLVARYTFANGAAADVTGNGNNGTLVGSPTFVSGVGGQAAIQLNGSQYVSVPYESDLALRSFSVSLWVNSSSSNDLTVLKNTGTGNWPFDIQINGASHALHGDLGIGSSWLSTNVDANIPGVHGITASYPTNAWHMITYTVTNNGSTNNATYQIYYDGQAANIGVGNSGVCPGLGSPLFLSAGHAMQIGSNGSSGLVGMISDVDIFGTPLTSTQIASLYSYESASLQPPAPSLATVTALTISANATFDLGGNSQQVASLSDGSPGAGAAGGVINSSSAACVLTISPTGGSTTFSGTIRGGGTLGMISLMMNGSGTQVFAGSNTYTGDTVVSAGTLILDYPDLVLTSNVWVDNLGTGGLLDLNYSGTDSINALYINGVEQPSGIWGGPGSGAPNTSSYLTGSGLLNVTVPEPSTMALLCVGTIVLLGYHRRRGQC
jgi:autotransporter-associated beta strand protein